MKYLGERFTIQPPCSILSSFYMYISRSYTPRSYSSQILQLRHIPQCTSTLERSPSLNSENVKRRVQTILAQEEPQKCRFKLVRLGDVTFRDTALFKGTCMILHWRPA